RRIADMSPRAGQLGEVQPALPGADVHRDLLPAPDPSQDPWFRDGHPAHLHVADRGRSLRANSEDANASAGERAEEAERRVRAGCVALVRERGLDGEWILRPERRSAGIASRVVVRLVPRPAWAVAGRVEAPGQDDDEERCRAAERAA